MKTILTVVFVVATVITCLAVFWSSGAEAEYVYRTAQHLTLPSHPSARQLINESKAEYVITDEDSAQRLLDAMDGDTSQAFEALEFGYATVHSNDPCEVIEDGYDCNGVIVTDSTVTVGDLIFERYWKGQ